MQLVSGGLDKLLPEQRDFLLHRLHPEAGKA